MRAILFVLLAAALVACGGRSNRAPAGVAFAAGPIADACQRSGRDAASRPLCQCIQAVADRELSRNDRTRAASFFGNPDLAHAVRLSDTRADDAFWARYTDWAASAERTCRRVA